MPSDLPAQLHEAEHHQRVLFITRKWGPAVGGMETYCERLTEELAKSRALDVIALEGQANGQPPSVGSLLAFPFKVLARLFRQRQKPAIVHLGDMAIWPLALLALLFFPSAKVVLSAHGTDVSYALRRGGLGSVYAFYQRLGAKLLGRANIIANSHATAEALHQIGWTNTAVVPLATDVQFDGPFEPSGEILFAGRLIPLKGCAWFIRNVLPKLPVSTRLVVAGTVWDNDEGEALKHSQVKFLGPLPQQELAKRFASAKCVILPNIELPTGQFEGFGLVAPEAASAGGVVIASSSGGLRDAVIDRETGFLLPPGDVDAWVAMVVEVLDWGPDKRANFVANSQRTARQHFSWSRVAAETEKVYLS